jgi:hypothetical protein
MYEAAPEPQLARPVIAETIPLAKARQAFQRGVAGTLQHKFARRSGGDGAQLTTFDSARCFPPTDKDS